VLINQTLQSKQAAQLDLSQPAAGLKPEKFAQIATGDGLMPGASSQAPWYGAADKGGRSTRAFNSIIDHAGTLI
jgi:hypothetical protein